MNKSIPQQTREYFEEIRILREYARDILGMTKAKARQYAAANAKDHQKPK